MKKDFNKIDQIARDAFEGFEVDFNPEDWKLMEEKLDNKEHLMPYIWLYKGLEASVLLLFLFTGLHFLYQNNSTASASTDLEGVDSEKMDVERNTEKDAHQNVLAWNHSVEIREKEESSIAEEGVVGEHQSDEAVKETIKDKSNSSQWITKSVNTFNKHENSKLTQTTQAVVDNEEINPSTSISSSLVVTEEAERTEVSNKTELLEHENEKTFSRTKFSHQEIEVVDLRKALAEHNGGGDNVISIKSKYRYPKIYRPKMLLSIFAGADYNRASSEGVPQLGVTFGVSLENEINERFSIYYGLIATRKNFEDFYTREIDRTASEGVVYTQIVERQAALSTLQIPLFFNMMLYQNAKWELNASLGVSGHLLATRYVKGTMRTSTQQTAGGLVNISEINSDAQEKAAFQGGNIQNNIFATAGIALDLERQLSRDFKLYLHPQYQHALNAVGNQQDRLSSFSLVVGLKKAL